MEGLQENIWIDLSKLDDLSKAVSAGTDKDGSPTYVARCHYGTETIPGKLVVRPNSEEFYISYDGREIKVDNGIQVLVDDGYSWEPESRTDGLVPYNAVIGGKSRKNVAHYIGRARRDNVWISGKIDTSNKCLYIPYDGDEHKIDHYYVLVRTIKGELKKDTKESSSESSGCLAAIGRAFSNCKINITNCTCFKIN